MNSSVHTPLNGRVLVLDDEPDLCALYELTLLREGHRVAAAATVAEAQALLNEQTFDVVISDMRLPDGLGIEVLRRLAREQRQERCVMITAYGSAESAVESLKCGAFDYLTKPVDLKQFRAVVRAALAASRVTEAPEAVRKAAPSDAVSARPPARAGGDALAQLIGESASIRGVKSRIVLVARGMAPVLITGESGTGKELVAQAIHQRSHRAAGPFVPVNCGAIPEALLEAEFFGARKGSYTGALQDRAGFFQAASGGTLFLDEIGDLPLAMQAKLLRAVQERRVRPLGDTQEEPVDVRVISATHKDLAAEVAAGRFRQDLFYRLAVIEIVVPPLRERREDLPALCEALLAKVARESGMEAPPLSAQQVREIMAAPLAGNVRELENLLHRAVALHGASDFVALAAPEDASAGPAQTDQGDAPSSPPTPPLAAHVAPSAGAVAAVLPDNLQRWLDAQERMVLVRALRESGFNRTAAASRLGLNLRQIRYRMARLGIRAPDDDAPNDDEAD